MLVVVKMSPSNPAGGGLVPGWEAKIPHIPWAEEPGGLYSMEL